MSNNQERIKQFLDEVWSEGKVEAVDVWLAPQYTIHHDPGDPWHGKTLDIEGYKERLITSRAPFPDQQFHIQELIGEGGEVAVAWLWTGTHDGDMPGFPATGNVVSMSGLTIYYFEGDRVSGHWQVTDRLGVFQQLSAGVKPGE